MPDLSLAIANAERDEQTDLAQSNIIRHRDTNPDQAAAEQERVVESRAARDMQLLQSSPRLRQYMSTASNAAIAHDDISALSFWESVGRWTAQGWRPGHAGDPRDADRVLSGLRLRSEAAYANSAMRNMRIAELTERENPESAMTLIRASMGLPARPVLTEPERQELAALRARQRQLPEARDASDVIAENLPIVVAGTWASLENSWRQFTNSFRDSGEIIRSSSPLGAFEATVNAPFAASAAAIAGAPQGAAAFMYEQEAGNAFEEYSQYVDRDGNRIDPHIAGAYARDVGLINAGLEFVGISAAIKLTGADRLLAMGTRPAVRAALRRIGFRQIAQRAIGGVIGAGLAEGTTEASQETVTVVLGRLAQEAQGGEWDNATNEQVAERIWKAFEVGGLLGGLLGSVPSAIEFSRGMEDVRRARVQEQIYQSLNEGAATSALRQRAPARFADAVNQMTEGTPLQEARINAEKFVEAFNQDVEAAREAADKLEGVGRAALDAALESGGEMVVPMGTYASQIAGTKAHEALAPHVRLGPNFETPAETRARLEHGDELAQVAEEARAQQRQHAEQKREIASAVEEALSEQFAKAGFIPQAQRQFVRAFAEHIATMAQSEGISPEAVLARLNFSLRGPLDEFTAPTPMRDEINARVDNAAADIPRNVYPRESVGVARPKAGLPVNASEAATAGEIDGLAYAAGDMLVTDGKSTWPVGRAIFDATYAAADKPGTYQKRTDRTVGHFVLTADREIQTREGPKQAKAGDVVLIGQDGEMWPVSAERFAERYAPVDEAAPFDQVSPAAWIAERFSPEEIADYLALADDPYATPGEILSHPIQKAMEAEAGPSTFTKEAIIEPGALADREYTVDGETFDADGYLEHMRAKFEDEVGAPLRQERKAVIITGQPGAGKSTTRAALAGMYGAVSVDLDEMRVGIPEFDGGRGSSITTQLEAGELRQRLSDELVSEGQNLLVEIVGRAQEHVLDAAARLQAQGYSVSLVNVDVSYDNSVRRYAKRTIAGGRWVHAAFIETVKDTPAQIFDALVAEGSLTGYMQIDGNGPKGSETVKSAHGEIDAEAFQAAIQANARPARPGRGDGLSRDGGSLAAGFNQIKPDEAWTAIAQSHSRGGNEPGIVWHGSAAPLRGIRPVLFTSNDRETATFFARLDRKVTRGMQRLTPLRTGFTNPLIVDGKGHLITNEVERRGKLHEFIDQAIADGHDAIVFNNVIDGPGDPRMAEPTNVVIVLDPTKVEKLPADYIDASPVARTLLRMTGSFQFFHGDARNAPRGSAVFGRDADGRLTQAIMQLFEGRNLSTPIHEMGHIFLESLRLFATEEAASARTKAMWATTLEWLGVTDEQWSEMSKLPGNESYNALRPYHEQFARGFEAYAREGKAPSMALREAFNAFKKWLVWIYKSVTELRVNLTPEMRDVFDRLLATDEAIKEARAEQGGVETLTREQFGPKGESVDKQYERYLRDIERADMEAAEEIDKAAMGALWADRTRWWRKREAQVRRAVEINFSERKAQRALAWLSRGVWENGTPPEGLEPMRLSPAQLVEEYGRDIVDQLPPGLVATDVEAAYKEAQRIRKALNAREPTRLAQAIRYLGGIDPNDPNAGDVTAIEGRKPGTMGALVAPAQYRRVGKETVRVPARSIHDLTIALWEMGYFGAKPEKGGFMQLAGFNAATANIELLGIAREMEKQGASHGLIWQQTGWARSPLHGDWQFEIDPTQLRLNYNLADLARRDAILTLGELADWPDLFAAYPHLADITVHLYRDANETSGGSYMSSAHDGKGAIFILNPGGYRASERMMSTLRHEIAHAIAENQDWPRGYNSESVRKGSPRWQAAYQHIIERQAFWRKVIRGDAAPTAEDLANAEKRAAYEVYLLEKGEMEARLVEARARLDAETRRMNPPGSDIDAETLARTWRAPVYRDAYSSSSQRPDAGGARNGQRAYEDQLRADGFAVDETMYHGTNADFETFDVARSGSRRPGDFGSGIYLTPHQTDGSLYARNNGIEEILDVPYPDGANVRPVVVRMRNPEVIYVSSDTVTIPESEIAQYRAAGRDGLVIRRRFTRDDGTVADWEVERVVFDPENIRPRYGPGQALPDGGSAREGFGTTPFFRGAVHEVDASKGPNGMAFFTPSREFAGEFPRALPAEQRRVGEYRLREDQLADFRNPETQQRVLAELADDTEATAHLRRRISQMGDKATGHIDWVISADPAIRDAVERAGYSGMWLDEGGGQASVAVFRNSDITRAQPNAGTADNGSGFYQGDPPDLNDFLGQLQRDLRGDPIYKLDDHEAADERNAAMRAREWFARFDVDVTAPAKELRAQIERAAPMMNADGVDADVAASVFGYDSGRELLDALIAEPKRSEWVAATVKQRMLDEHGDIFNDGTIAEEAQRAAHSAGRVQVIERQLDAIARATGDAARPVARAAKMVAEQQIGRMHIKQVRDYNWFLGAERRHAKAAMAAMREGDFQEARMATHRQLVNHYLYSLARKAADEMDAAQRYLKKFDSPGVRANIDNEYLDQIDQLLEQYDLRKVPGKEAQRRMALAAWVKKMEDAGLGHMVNIDPAVLEEARRRSFASLDLDEARGLIDSVKNIEHLGRLKERLLEAADKREFRAIVADLVDRLNFTGPISNQMSENYSPNDVERGQNELRKAHAQMTRMEFLFRYLDGQENGPLWQALWLPFVKAADKESLMMHGAARQMTAIWDRYTSSERTRTFKTRIPMHDLPVGAATSYTKAELFAIALNLGNDGNVKALIDGFEWGRQVNLRDAEIDYVAVKKQIVDALGRVFDERDWQTVQQIWDLIGQYRDEAFQLQEDLTGVRPEAVEATPVDTPYGQIAGGYYPLKFDRTRDQRVAKADDAQEVQERWGSNWFKPMTRKGHTINRVGSGGRPVKLSLTVMSEHVQNVVHDIAYRRAVIDVDRIITDAEFSSGFIKVAGLEMYEQLRPWLQAIASDRVDPSSFMWQFLQKLRGNVAIAAMGYRLSTGLQQLTGLLQAVPMLGSVEMASALVKLVGNPAEIANKAQWILGRSEFMRTRVKTYDRDVRETIERMDNNDPLHPIRQNAFALVGMFDWATSSVVWTAAYEKARAGKVDGIDASDEQAAVYFADSAVRTTQSAGLPQDLPAIMRGAQTNKLLTMFFSYFSVLYNWTAYDQIMGVRKGRLPLHVFIGNMALIYVISPLIAEALAGRMAPRDDEDDDEFRARMLSVVARFPFQTVPVLRDIANAVGTGFEYQLSPAQSGPAQIAKAIQDVAAGRTFESEATGKRAVTAIGYAFGLPTPQAWTTIDYVADKLEGEEEGFDFYEAVVRDTR